MVVHVHSIYRFILFQKPILRIGGKLSRIDFKLNSAKGRWRKCPFLKLLQCYCLPRIFLYNNSKLGLIIVFFKGGLISEGIFALCPWFLIRKGIWYASNFRILRNIYFDFFFNVQNWDSQQGRDSFLQINKYYVIFENLTHTK